MYSERASRLPGGVVWSHDGRSDEVRPGQSAAVLPDGCTDLMFDGSELIIAGPDTMAYIAEPPDGIAPPRFIGLRMSSGIGPALWGVPGDQLVNQRVALSDLWPAESVRELTEQVAASDDPGAVLEQIAARRWRANPPDRAMVDVAVALRGGASVADVAFQVGYSERQLHRRSLAAYGYGAKTLGRILRLTGALDLARTGAAFSSVAVTWGYADQAHLSREVRALTGMTLSEIVG